MTIPAGLCQCGCGMATRVVSETNRHHGVVKGQPRRFVRGHSMRGSNHYRWTGGRSIEKSGYVKRAGIGSVSVREHVRIAEMVLGKPLPKGVEVHHVNGDKADNRSSNLVICQDRAYHFLLHRRALALAACGNASWRKCSICKTWDDPANLYTRQAFRAGKKNGTYVFHRTCHARRVRERKACA